MSEKTKKVTIITLVAVLILSAFFGAGYVFGKVTTLGPESELGAIPHAWNLIFETYVEKDKLDAVKLSQGGIRGIVKALDDPYSAYLDPETHQLGITSVHGIFEGIGAHVGMRDEKITIIAPIEGTPAEKAGIKPGDVILAINGETTEELSLNEAVLKIRGQAGTPVILLVLHQDETEPVEIEIIRAPIEVPSVRYEMKDNIAYIRLIQFTMRTTEELRQALEGVIQENPVGIVLDLRYNPGGVVQATVDATSFFLPEGIVLKIVDNEKRETIMEVKQGGLKTDLPMVVLVNEFSASSSEVMSGALQDYGRATIAGKTTFGKGSVNNIFNLFDGSGLFLTTARWLTPNGNLIEGTGITPDYELDLEDDEAVQWAIDFLKGNK